MRKIGEEKEREEKRGGLARGWGGNEEKRR